ncbi:MAG: tetratricopeptide repeat protein [Bacteroidales bacterium]|nr:tetratricopeptide repeat protein [Bacteroidales bacterium]
MLKENINKKHQSITAYITNKQIKDALDVLKELTIEAHKEEHFHQFKNLIDTYQNILKYTINGIEDPQRQEIFARLLVAILELSDKAKETIFTNSAEIHTYRIKKQLEKEIQLSKEEAVETVENLSFNRELAEILTNTSVINQEKNHTKNYRDTLIKIFNIIWLTDKYKESDVELLRTISKANNIPWYEKCIFVSALTISLLRCFDEKKINLLIEFYETAEDQLWQRALTGLLIALYYYDKRLILYPEIINKLKKLSNNNEFNKNIEIIIIQFIKSKETENITKKLHEEILPEIAKFKPKLEDKLNLDKLYSEDFFEDKNPDWETFFEDSPDLFEKIEEFSKLQMEGSDVFLSAFAMLKYFDFFKELSNWFLPFYKQNETLKESLQNEKENLNTELFLDGLSRSLYMCNSDKYSFCLNIKHMPQMQKSMMMELFNAEIESMNEIANEDEILNKPIRNKNIFTQYIQDLYRFYKLYPLKSEFTDIFNFRLDFHNTFFFNLLAENNTMLKNIVEFYFEKNYFKEALEIYSKIYQSENKNYEIFEKIAYCYQRLGNFKEALKFYQQAELFDTNTTWILKKIAFCYRNLNNPEKALKYYLEVEKSDPENLYIQASIGNCYLDMKDFEKSLEYFYKVEYSDTSNRNILRPIAWCLFVLGKLDIAKKYYRKLIKEETNKYDFMNFGHVELCLGNKQKAIEYYKKSINQKDNNLELFMSGFNDDKEYLLKHGVDIIEIPLVVDYLKYSI